MKTYQEYYEEWVLSTESRDLSFEEWLMLLLDRKEKEMVDKACDEYCNRCPNYADDLDGLQGCGKRGCDVLRDFRKAVEE